MAKIFPIPLSRHLAEDLIRRHCHAEFSHGWRSMTAVYSYSGKILDEDGNCAFTCTYNSDDGFVMSSGPIFINYRRQSNNLTERFWGLRPSGRFPAS